MNEREDPSVISYLENENEYYRKQTAHTNEFKDVLSTRRYQSAYWQNRLGQFYLKHKDYNNAIFYFTTGIKDYPKSNRMAMMYAGLGDAYLGIKNPIKALEAYKKSIAIKPDQEEVKLKIKTLSK